MKKSEWDYLAKAMWSYADKHEGKISGLLKELVVLVNHHFFTIGITEVNIDDMGKYEQNATSDRPNDTDSTSGEN